MTERDLSGRILGEFVLRELIGRGGFGDVYRSAQPRLQRDVVVKVLRAQRHRDHSARERFLREAQLASRLDHHYAAHVYASGVDHADGLLWIAMELVHGITLDDWLRHHGAMALAQFVPFFERVAEVVHAAHRRGIVHRDLKPSNVMVLERDGVLIPKLLDFGIAKASPAPGEPPEAELDVAPADRSVTRTDQAAGRLTGVGDRVGSAPYMAPEQWDHACAVGPASDVYSLGALAYQALTGHPPFTAANEREYYRHHITTEVPAPGGDLPREVERALRRALAKTPEARHRTALELAAELRAALRASQPEMLRSAAQQWDDRARAPELLWGGGVLAEAQRWTRGAAALGELECSFVAASRRRARRAAWLRRLVGALAVAAILGALIYRAALQARLARRVADATITQAELEEGRSALLHGEPGAQGHLWEAYRRDPAPATAFMLARALQPRLAEQARLPSSRGRMWSATFSPDGHHLATTDDHGAQIWDAQTYRLRLRLPHDGEVYHATYSADGAQLVTAGQGGVRIWDPTTGALVHALAPGKRSGDYYLAALSPDGTRVAAIDVSGSVARVWSAATGDALAELASDASEFPGLAFSADGRWLAITGGREARVFDTTRWAQVAAIPEARRLAFDPTGPRLATGSVDGDASLWAIPNGARLRHLREVGEPIDAVAFSPDGQLIATASRDGAEQVWQAGSGRLHSQVSPRHTKVLSLEFDRTSRLVVAAGGDGSVVVVDAASGMVITALEGPQSVVRAAHFDPGGGRVVGASLDGTARVWATRSAYRRWSSPAMGADCGLVARRDLDRRFIAVGCRDHPTRIWDTANDRLIAELPSVPRGEDDHSAAFPVVSADGDRAAIARGNTVEVYELPTVRLLRTIEHHAAVTVVSFATTSRDLVSGASDGSLVIARDGGALLALPTASGSIDAAAFLPDGRVVTSDAHCRLRTYDVGGEVVTNLELPGRAMALRIGGTLLVTVPSYFGNATPPALVDLARARVITQLTGHIGLVFSARWLSRDRILTTGEDGTARLWDGATGQLRQTYRGGSRFLADAALSSDGTLIIAGGGDGVLRFWDATSTRLLWTLQAHHSHLIAIHVEGNDLITRGFTGEISRWTLPISEQVIEACEDHDCNERVHR